MIGWDDVYKLIASMFPLYFALILGYGSVKWWHLIKPDHCGAINQLNCYFIMPLFTFDFASRINPYKMNFRFLVADGISKSIVLVVILLWAKFSSKGNYRWSITSFSLSAFNNTLVVGVPLMHAMYGPLGENLVIQASILQLTIYMIILLVMYAFWSVNESLDQEVGPNDQLETDLEGNPNEDSMTRRPSLLIVLKVVGIKLAKNPNTYASVLAVSWAFVANR
ncbi:Auxin efflux carrier [Cynara cardunculus var. scolymus]|uniref:Auxin efflux carrier n=2 Tax=Cynara cardunculus var. scolymus TaxID=59895 RepID=A0A124SC72_CYNCS|nr:Auxin efflux carrier [Cynara cardunculus var. scolymus]